MNMNVPKIGFSGNYCIKADVKKNADNLTIHLNNTPTDDKMKMQLKAYPKETDVYVITNNRQWSLTDYNLLKEGIARAKHRDNSENNPFSDDGFISKALDKSFERVAETEGYIGNG
ncbi:MAG: hypothetical protein WCG23_04180 [bacterium]